MDNIDYENFVYNAEELAAKRVQQQKILDDALARPYKYKPKKLSLYQKFIRKIKIAKLFVKIVILQK